MRHLLHRLATRAVLAILVALVLAPGSARAAEPTALDGALAGIEVCPQIWCGAAIFVGRFGGTLDGDAGKGRWWVAVNHEALPDAGASAVITGGEWGIRVGERPLRGAVSGGSILNNGDGTFTVTPFLDVSEGGTGALTLSIRLDHGTFPPIVEGLVALAASGVGRRRTLTEIATTEVTR